MAGEVFVDTSAWYPIADPDDPAHARLAAALRDKVSGGFRIVTTNLVVAETHALLMRRIHREVARSFVKQIRLPPQTVVLSTQDVEKRAVNDWLEKYNNQDFTFTDAVSFAVMSERGIREALALDHQFAVAGFVVFPEDGR